MTRNYTVNSEQTINIINQLLDDGVKKIAAMIRHSDRFYATEPVMEPFMGLNENGKTYAYDMGTQLRLEYPPKLCSSLMARCVETAYLIDKGFTKQHGISPGHNCMDADLFAFYIKDFVKAISHVTRTGTHPFLRSWFNKELGQDVMQDPLETTDRIIGFMLKTLNQLEENQVAICVSHDWNVFPIKEFKLNLPHEEYGDIGYLDGVIFFEKNGKHYLTSYQAKEPVQLY